jgi:FkbM family methyltransferase
MNSRVRNALRWRWFAFHRRFGLDLTVGIGPGRLRLAANDKLAGMIYLLGFELPERDLFARILRPGDSVIDVGANIGLYSILSAGCVGPQGAVHAFEPVPETMRRLRKNVALNGYEQRVRCVEAAASVQDGVGLINVPEEGGSFSSLGAPLHGTGTHKSVEVRCVRLDTYVAENGLTDVWLVKLDVEGWETHVINGATELLATQRPHLLVEFSDATAGGGGGSCAELYGTLTNLGYRLFRFDSDEGEIIEDPLREHYDGVNLLATQRPNEIRERLASRSPETAAR